MTTLILVVFVLLVSLFLLNGHSSYLLFVIVEVSLQSHRYESASLAKSFLSFI